MTGNHSKPRRRARWIVQLETDGDNPVLKVLDTRTDTVFREIPIKEFLEYARHNKDIGRFLMGQLTPNETPRPVS